MRRQRLPLGLQSFSDLRAANCYYVDKTPLIRELIDQGSHYFLSRPRRFGKSLLVDTLAELFACNEPLFRGLHIHDGWDWDAPHPVIRLSFEGDFRASGDLARNVAKQLEIIERVAGLPPGSQSDSGPDRLRDVLQRRHHQAGRKAVVLVDEYDKPITDVLEDPARAKANRDYLRGFYGVLKGQAEHVRFVLVTGVSMFSKVSLFSGLNNLRDISLNPAFATICGYTENDLDTVFAPELEGLDRDEIQRWYNGYHWRGSERVYNPYDVLLLFAEREFDAHWFRTGTPAFLYRLMMQRGLGPMDLEGRESDGELLSTFDVEAIDTNALMFQAGYLTIVGEERVGDRKLFKLDYPNHEVRTSLNMRLLQHVASPEFPVASRVEELGALLAGNDFKGFEARLRAFFASVPYQWSTAAGLARYEAWYAGMLFACFRSTGLDVRAEESTAHGRSDMVLLHGGQVFVMECKMAGESERAEAAVARAMTQMRERGYADRYMADGKPVHLVALVFGHVESSVGGARGARLASGERNLIAVRAERR